MVNAEIWSELVGEVIDSVMHVVRDLHSHLPLVVLVGHLMCLYSVIRNIHSVNAVKSTLLRFCLFPPAHSPTSKMEAVKKIWREADAVMFDVDSTVVREEGIDRLAEFLGKGPQVSEITSEAMNKGLDFREALKLRLNILAPTLKQLEEFIRLSPTTLTPGIQELVELLKSRGTAVYLVSGGLRRVIEPIRVLLNIPEENLFANRLFFENGKYVGFDLNEPTSKKGGKAEVAALLKNKFGYKRLVMIGDGSTDADACPPADAFIGFGGNVIRENVRSKAQWFVLSFQVLIDELKTSS